MSINNNLILTMIINFKVCEESFKHTEKNTIKPHIATT